LEAGGSIKRAEKQYPNTLEGALHAQPTPI